MNSLLHNGAMCAHDATTKTGMCRPGWFMWWDVAMTAMCCVIWPSPSGATEHVTPHINKTELQGHACLWGVLTNQPPLFYSRFVLHPYPSLGTQLCPSGIPVICNHRHASVLLTEGCHWSFVLLKLSLWGASLGKACGDPGLPSCQNPPSLPHRWSPKEGRAVHFVPAQLQEGWQGWHQTC